MTSQDSQSVHRTGAGRDREAAGAFTFRPMQRWQLWGVSLFGAAVVIGLLAYATVL